jgi:uncharacterized membrane protein
MITGSLPISEALLLARMLATLALATWAARPLAQRLLPGQGAWVAALLLGWLVVGFVPWWLAAVGLVDFAQASLGGIAALLVGRLALGPARHTKGALALAAAGVGLIWLGLAQRLEKAALSGLEKFTDMVFLTAAMRATTFPPADPWYAGESVNYYYVGQAMVGAWGNLLGARADHIYQLAMAALFAMTGLAVWAMTTRLARPVGRWGARGIGAFAATLALYGGNFHSALYTLARPLMPTTQEAFYFPNSTRFIGFDPDVADKAFTEFTAYAFAVGDLHAHVAALPIFMLGLMILLSVVTRGLRGHAPDTWQAVGFGWLLGLGAIVNSWDVAVLGMLALLAIAVVLARGAGPWHARLDKVGVLAVLVVAAALLTAAPFLGHFMPFASGIEGAPARTPLWQWLVLYGHGVIAALALAWAGMRGRQDLTAGFLFAGAVILLIVPEIVIVRDIYGLDYARANTMFKLSFRAQTLLVIAGAATIALVWARKPVAAGGVAAVMASLLTYAPHIAIAPAAIRSLDGLGFLGDERALVEAARTLDLHGGAMIEASGPAFGETARVSAMTGQPVVVGWAAHQWLWRNDGLRPNRRADMVRQFYTTPDPAQRCLILRRFDIRYAVLGQIERRFYESLQEEAILNLGPAIHDGPGGQIVQIDPRRCEESLPEVR